MHRPLMLAVALVLSGCGSAYVSPVVSQHDADLDVRVVALTGETVIVANRESDYTPPSLPAYFSQSAGYGPGLRGAGALPEAPLEPVGSPPRIVSNPPPAVDVGPYRIGVGDIIILATRQGGSSVEELSGLLAAQNRRQGYTVQDDGAIAIPDVGRVELGGLTLAEAEAILFQTLINNQIDPSFSIEVSEFNSQRIAIGGVVRQPGVVPLGLTPIYLQEAIASSGGITVEDQENLVVRIFRNGQLYQIPYGELYQRSGSARIQLIDGDSVFVESTYALSEAQSYFQQQIQLSQLRQSARSQALAELQMQIGIQRQQLQELRGNYLTREELGAVDRDYVYLAGEVGQQGRFPMPYEQQISLADALLEFGGVASSTGNPGEIYVLRASDDPREFGAVTAWHLNAANMVNMTLATRFELRPDDIVFVAEQPITRWNRVVQQIVPSLITSGVAAATN